MRALLLGILLGCSSSSTVPSVAADAAVADTAPDVAADASKAAACASAFGDALTNSFGRLDGTVTAIVGPKDTQCPMPNDDHVVVQVSMAGKIYRMVVNVQSDRGADLRVRLATIEHALPPPAWTEGWHTGLSLDYVLTLDAHTTAFTPYEMAPLVERVTDAISIGAPVSVYAWSSGGASAHKVHRNTTGGDGAIVLDPKGDRPRWLLFQFADQMF